MTRAELEKIVEELYAQEPGPLYIAKVGMILGRKYGIKVLNLYDFLNTLDNFCVVSVPGVKEKSAVAKRGEEEKILQLILAPKLSTTPAIQFLSMFPRTLLLAFCQSPDEFQEIFIQKVQPFHFFTSRQSDDVIEIDKQFRIAAWIPYELKKLQHTTAEVLEENIKSWSETKGISLEEFKKELPPRSDERQQSLLERLIEAIPHDLRKDMQLSLEIVSHLHGMR